MQQEGVCALQHRQLRKELGKVAYVLLTAVQLPRKAGQGNGVVITLQGDHALQQLMLDDQGHDIQCE